MLKFPNTEEDCSHEINHSRSEDGHSICAGCGRDLTENPLTGAASAAPAAEKTRKVGKDG